MCACNGLMEIRERNSEDFTLGALYEVVEKRLVFIKIHF